MRLLAVAVFIAAQAPAATSAAKGIKAPVIPTQLSESAAAAASAHERAQAVAGKVGGESKAVTLKPKSRGYALHSGEYKFNTTGLDLSALRNVISIDTERRIIHAESMVSMETLVRAALAHGMVPKVVPPFREMTVGGAETCSYIEVALGNGTLVTCSKTENAELYHSIAGSYGTLGVVTRAGLECEPAGKYVRVAYSRHHGLDHALAHIKRLCRAGQPPELPPDIAAPDFLDAVVMGGVGETAAVQRLLVVHAWHEVMPEAVKADKKLPLFTCHRSTELFYTEHLEDVSKLLDSTNEASAYEYTERMPTEDYLFRFDRGAFWLANARGRGGSLILTTAWLCALASRSLLARLFFRWLLSSSNLFLLLRAATPDLLASRYILMSAAMPADRARDLVMFTRNTVPVRTPLYLCPVKGAGARQPFAPHGHVHTLFVEVGIWGRVDDGKAKEHTRRLEHFITAQQGRKHLGTQNFYEPTEFWRGYPLYNPEEYKYLRGKYSADGHFPDLSSKVCEPSTGRKGLVQKYIDSRRRKFVGVLL